MSKTAYIGRFAPSPSGPLHLGSLMSATCSYLQAKSQHGKWLVRIEDVDTPRVVKDMASLQLKQLEQYGFEWDDAVLFQSTRINDYNDIIHQLALKEQIYACACTRKQLKNSAETSEIGIIYPQICRHKRLNPEGLSLRFKTEANEIRFEDTVYGQQLYNLQKLCSDWVIRRNDGIIAYHLAVVADDAFQGITEVVRGFDLLALTPIHIELQNELCFTQPKYCHHPLLEQNGKKLSKQNHAPSIKSNDIIHTLNSVLDALGQKRIASGHLEEFWKEAIKQWDPLLIPTVNTNL